MSDLEFTRPVHIHRMGRSIEVESVGEGLALLKQWPASHRGALFTSALESCEAAMEGEVTAEEAREALAELAAIGGLSALARGQGSAERAGAEAGLQH